MCSADWGCSLIGDGGRGLLLQRCINAMEESVELKKKKQDDCMKGRYIDSMTYTWASFMHGDMADKSNG